MINALNHKGTEAQRFFQFYQNQRHELFSNLGLTSIHIINVLCLKVNRKAREAALGHGTSVVSKNVG